MHNNFKKDLAYFVTGAIVGGVAAAFSTPMSGRRLRRIARHNLENCSDQIKEVSANLRETGDQLVQQGEKLVHEAERLFA